jgi:cytochrome c553
MNLRLTVCISLLGCLGLSASATAGESIDFDRQVRPIFEASCWKCHGPDKQQGGLRLDRRDGATIAADSGSAAVVPGKVAESELVRRIEAGNEDGRMPDGADPLSADQIAILRSWIEQGAPWPDTADAPVPVRRVQGISDADRHHWSYLPLREVAPPEISSPWTRTPVDRFILSALKSKGLEPNPPIDRRRLIRRVYFDVTGLPPSPEQVESFVADPASDAYEKLVDRLLSSPHYGERWGRHWLDVARYADSDGLETDKDRPTAYLYRNFVIRALNDDLSYQTFVRWQLAGDEYEPSNPLAVAATGFLTAAPCEVLTVPMEDEKLRLRYNELDDMAATTASAFLGLTLACARCHDHKFDAIPTADYYRLQCAFTTTTRSGAEGAEPLSIKDKQPTPEPTWLLERGDFHSKKANVELGFFSVLTGSRTAAEYWAAARENPANPNSTQQRRALAEWITDPDGGAGALAARVMVNRVWQHHFGEGLVRTVSDFGVRGEQPTHPELLEWLAREFVTGGWRLKPLHRLILTSSVYMQDTTFDAERVKVDPENRLLWRRRPQRLEAEALRDAVLAVSGQLNLEPLGPAFKPPIPTEAIVARNTKDPYPQDAQDTPDTRRRTVYMFHKRVVQHPLMQAFDAPDAAVTCSRRNSTTVAPQALALLNDPFMRARANDFARRIGEGTGDDPVKAIDRGFSLALGRAPTDAQRAASLQFYNRQFELRAKRDTSVSPEENRLRAMADFCQGLFSLNEFVYID